MSRKATGLLAGTAALLLVLAGAVPASASDSSLLTPTEEQELRAQFEIYDVPVSTQDALIEKLDNGEEWDVYTGVAPVSSVVSEHEGYERTYDTYADGSISVSDMQIAVDAPHEVTGGDVSPMGQGIVGCTLGYSAGVSYGTDCWVYASTALTGASYYVSYSRWSTGSSVYNWHDPVTNTIGGSWYDRKFVTLNGGTAVQLQWKLNVGGYYSTSGLLRTLTSPSSVWLYVGF
jgi:hypothetical protein